MVLRLSSKRMGGLSWVLLPGIIHSKVSLNIRMIPSFWYLGMDNFRQKNPRKAVMRLLENLKNNFVGLDSVIEAGRVARDRSLWKPPVDRQLFHEHSCNVLRDNFQSSKSRSIFSYKQGLKYGGPSGQWPAKLLAGPQN